MEQNFYRDDFEQMLKDTSEEFRMYPSRKVWHSIYNDFHPDRKWPSFTVCLVLLTSILYIGISNNNNISKNSRNLLVQSIISTDNVIEPSLDEPTVSSLNPGVRLQAKEIKKETFRPQESTANTIISSASTNIEKDNSKNEGLLSSFQESPDGKEKENLAIDDIQIFSSTDNTPTNANNIDESEMAKVINIEQAKNFTKVVQATDIDSPILDEETKNLTTPIEILPSSTKPTVPGEERQWIEDYAFHNKKNKDKWKRQLSVQYYITPSIGYRELFKNNDFESVNGGLLLRTSNEDIISQQAAVNLEMGANLLFDVNKRLSFKTGLQLNLTNYITNAHKLQHPSQTTVLMNDLNNNTIMPVAYNSNHGNVLGSNLTSLNNKTYQVSIPVGLNYKVAGSEKVKWFVGGTIQPTFIKGGNVYLISADNKNFVEDPSMLRSWNLNSSLETFVSFKTPSGISINAGPQLRYQLISSYSKQYTYTEKLYNVGIKLGLTKKL